MTTTDKLIATIIRALKVAVIKADSTTLIEQTYNPAIIAANELEAEIIRNHQPEPTQKQVDEAELLEIITVLQASGWEYGTHPMVKARIVLDAIRPYLRQVDNVGEPQQVSGDGIERCIQVCRDLSREYSGNPDDKTLDEIIVDAKEAIAALQTPQPTVEAKGETVTQENENE